MSTPNPYQSPFGELRPPVMMPTVSPPADGAPLFTTVMAGIDLAFCILRAVLVALGFVGAMVLRNRGETAAATSAILEVVTGGAMVLFGLPANGLLLAKKPLGILLGSLLILATLGSLGVGIFQGLHQMQGFQSGSPEQVGGIVGLVFVVGLRLALIAAYGFALVLFQRWHASRAATSP